MYSYFKLIIFLDLCLDLIHYRLYITKYLDLITSFAYTMQFVIAVEHVRFIYLDLE